MTGNAPKRLINNWRTVMAAPPATPPCSLDGPHGPDCHHAATLAAAPTTDSSCAKYKTRRVTKGSQEFKEPCSGGHDKWGSKSARGRHRRAAAPRVGVSATL